MSWEYFLSEKGHIKKKATLSNGCSTVTFECVSLEPELLQINTASKIFRDLPCQKNDLEKKEAEARRIFDPLNKIFDHGNKRCTDMAENKKVNLPKPVDNFSESSMHLLFDKMMKVFYDYRAKNCTEKLSTDVWEPGCLRNRFC